MSAAHYKLDNLTVIVDRNRLQQGDWTEQTMHLEPLADKWRAFGWSVREVDGHNIAELLEAFSRVPFEAGKPNCIIAHTHKDRASRSCGIKRPGITGFPRRKNSPRLSRNSKR
jgi:transketolase